MIAAAMRRHLRDFVCAVLGTGIVAAPAAAQDLFEIQVYPYETVDPHRTMAEVHMNFFPSGTKDAAPGEFPMNQQMHLTLEVTHGFAKYFECAGYLVTAAYVPNHGARFAGARLRPRFRLPEFKSFPFKVSLSFEYAFNRPGFDPNSQTLEIRPIFEREQGRLYLSINPDLGLAVKGPDAGAAPAFEPNFKVGWDFTHVVQAGIEYYAETGSVRHFDPWSDEHHIIFGAADLNVSPVWELNFGLGRGITGTSEQWIVKAIVGYRFKR